MVVEVRPALPSEETLPEALWSPVNQPSKQPKLGANWPRPLQRPFQHQDLQLLHRLAAQSPVPAGHRPRPLRAVLQQRKPASGSAIRYKPKVKVPNPCLGRAGDWKAVVQVP